MCSFALAYDSLALMASGFAVVCGFRIYEEVLQNRWLPFWRSILAKYEAAIAAADSSTGDP